MKDWGDQGECGKATRLFTLRKDDEYSHDEPLDAVNGQWCLHNLVAA